jgi:Flp pilus assembly protein TadG
MVATPFFVTLYAIVQVSLLYYAESMLETGVAEAARMIRTGQAQSASMGENEIRALVCGHVFGLIDCNEGLVVDVRAFPSFEDVAVPPAVGGAIGRPEANASSSTSRTCRCGSGTRTRRRRRSARRGRGRAPRRRDGRRGASPAAAIGPGHRRPRA